MLPTSISVNKGSRGGQEIYVIDASSGNMFLFNGASLSYTENIQLQNGNPALLSAYDLELSEDGRVGYVAHVTAGDGSSTPSGGISVVDLLNKTPIDSDNNSSTTSIGAPSGITRINVPANFVPLSLSDIFAPKLISELQVGNKWPGEYLFTLGVDTSLYTQVLNLLQIPAAGTAFNLNDLPGSFRIAVLDLNPWVVSSINAGKPTFAVNPTFRTFVQVFNLPSYIAISPAVRNLTLTVVIGQSPRRAHVYGYDPVYGTVTVIDFDSLTLVSPPTPLTPSHVKFVPSISQDLVQAADSQTGEIVSNIPFDSCLETNHSPTSLAIRSSGEKGYVSSFLSDSVSVIDTFANSLANNCNVSVGERPIQVAVQPVVNLDSEKDVILKQLYFSAPSDFTTSVKQSETLFEYADVLILIESGTDPEIISAVDEFQLGVEQSVVNTALRTPVLSSTKLMKSILVAPAALAAGIPVPHNSAGAWVFFGLSESGPSETELNKLKTRMDCLKHPYPTTAACTNMAAHDMTKNGSQFARIWIPWSIFEPCPGKFNTEFFNRIISRTVRSGQKVFITLADVMSPPWFWSASTSGCIASTVPVCSGGLGVGQSNQMKYWDEATNSAKNEDQYCEPENAEMETADAEEPMDECDRHKHDPKSVTSPHISIFKEFKPAQPAGCSNPKRYIKNYINKVFQNVLNNWAPFVIEVQVSLGRLNEPTFPYKEDFWWYDDAAVTYLQEKCGGPPPKENELGGTSEEQKAKRGCYFTNYQKAKQEWVNEVSGWVTNKLKPWQKYVVFPAGGHGDFKYPNPNASNTYYEIAKNNWAGADDNVKQTIRHGRDNYWLLGRARSQGWYAQYAGVQGNGCGPSSNCKWLSDNRNGYSGPLYAQIASLTTDCAQPETVANDVTDNSYFGHVWNKDSHLFESDGVTKSGCVGKSKRELNRLAVGWEDIVFEFGIDRRDTSITNLYVCSQDSLTSTASATISWETDEPSDSIVLYGKDSGYPTGSTDYMKNVAPNGTNYSYRTDTDHAVTLQGLTKGKKYYFAVFSTDAGGNTSVKEGNFIAGSGVSCGAPPPPTGSPVLESPIETWVDTRTPQFVWTTVAGADKYEFKILNSAGSVVYPTITVLNACTATSCSYTLPSGSPLTDQTENYSWNLRAHISAGNIWTPWSSARFSVYTFVSVNLSNDASQNSDIEKGLKRPANEPCDGKTIPEDFTTTPSMRKNKGTAMVVNSACNMDPAIPNTACTPEKPCQYIYFDVDERFMSADLDAQHPRVDITVEYFDHKPNTTWATHFCLKYKKNDANHTSACLPVPVTNTGTMKTHTFQIINAWFGDTVVGNDLRIECRTDASGNLTGSKDTRRWINKVEILKK
jgi:YVTN family beta-propeller protein